MTLNLSAEQATVLQAIATAEGLSLDRALWTLGLPLTLSEILEASESVRSDLLYDKALKALCASTCPLIAKDPGVHLATPHTSTRLKNNWGVFKRFFTPHHLPPQITMI